MGKDDAKKRHRSEKVALHESAKSSVSASEGGSSAQKVRKTTRCGRCNCEGHTARTCSKPPLKKRKRVGLTDWDLARQMPDTGCKRESLGLHYNLLNGNTNIIKRLTAFLLL